MASEASRKKAEEILGGFYPQPGRLTSAIAAALDEARAEGEKSGAGRERWECFKLVEVGTHVSWEDRRMIREAISARGPMRGPEDE